MNWLDVMFCVNNFSGNIKRASLYCMLPSTHVNFKFKALLHFHIVLIPSKSVYNHTLFPYIFCAKFFRQFITIIDHTARGSCTALTLLCKFESHLILGCVSSFSNVLCKQRNVNGQIPCPRNPIKCLLQWQ
jgi:hypothetical protein